MSSKFGKTRPRTKEIAALSRASENNPHRFKMGENGVSTFSRLVLSDHFDSRSGNKDTHKSLYEAR